PPPPAGDGLSVAPSQSASAPAASAVTHQPGGNSMLIFLLVMFGFMYFFIIRPQNKKLKEHQKVISALERGDDVVTSAGILGKITGITDKVVTLEVADNVRIKVLRAQVSQVVKGQIKELS